MVCGQSLNSWDKAMSLQYNKSLSSLLDNLLSDQCQEALQIIQKDIKSWQAAFAYIEEVS